MACDTIRGKKFVSAEKPHSIFALFSLFCNTLSSPGCYCKYLKRQPRPKYTSNEIIHYKSFFINVLQAVTLTYLYITVITSLCLVDSILHTIYHNNKQVNKISIHIISLWLDWIRTNSGKPRVIVTHMSSSVRKCAMRQENKTDL